MPERKGDYYLSIIKMIIGINKTDSDNHKMIIANAPTERWLLFVNQYDSGINKTDNDNHNMIIVIALTERW